MMAGPLAPRRFLQDGSIGLLWEVRESALAKVPWLIDWDCAYVNKPEWLQFSRRKSKGLPPVLAEYYVDSAFGDLVTNFVLCNDCYRQSWCDGRIIPLDEPPVVNVHLACVVCSTVVSDAIYDWYEFQYEKKMFGVRL